MTDRRSLYLVTEEMIIIGIGSLHKQLAERCGIAKEDVLGGGEFIYDKELTILVGESYDFGRAPVEIIQKHCANGDVYQYGKKRAPMRMPVEFSSYDPPRQSDFI